MSLSPPRIVCAAIKFQRRGKTMVIASPRHMDMICRYILAELKTGVRKRDEIEEGFIDQHGTYYTRLDAWEIAERNGQIARRVGGDGRGGYGLFSENLY